MWQILITSTRFESLVNSKYHIPSKLLCYGIFLCKKRCRKQTQTVEFEPGATALETEGAGYVVASLGVDSGYVPYTAFSAKDSYMKEHPEVIKGFTAALKQGMEYVYSHTAEETAAVITPQFPDTEKATMATIIKRYADQDTWKNDLVFEEDAFELLLDILSEAGQLSKRPEYTELVTVQYVR